MESLLFFAISIAIIIGVLGLVAVALQPHGILVVVEKEGRPIGLFYIHGNTISEVVVTNKGFTVGQHQVASGTNISHTS